MLNVSLFNKWNIVQKIFDHLKLIIAYKSEKIKKADLSYFNLFINI